MKTLHVGLIIIAYLFFSIAFASSLSSIEQKNTNIETSIIKAMSTFQVPGMAVAIVKDNKVVMSKGFGLTQYGTNNKVNGDTLFGVASNTKAMTAALLANLFLF